VHVEIGMRTATTAWAGAGAMGSKAAVGSKAAAASHKQAI
jgi:hypothetical protein